MRHVISLTLLIGTGSLLFKCLSLFFSKELFLVAFLTLGGYWFFSIFSYLYNSTKTSKYTTAVSRFWRRALMLFWMIEGYLFGVYVYLVLNAPIETEWMAHQGQLFSSDDYLNKEFFLSMSLLFAFGVALFTAAKLQPSGLLSRLLFVVLGLSSLKFFAEELFQFFYFVQEYFFYLPTFEPEDSIWEYSASKAPSLIFNQYVFLMVFLKFWHAVFIFATLFQTLRYILRDRLNPSALKVSSTNYAYFWIFSLIPLVTLWKRASQYSSGNVYFWFGRPSHLLQDYSEALLSALTLW